MVNQSTLGQDELYTYDVLRRLLGRTGEEGEGEAVKVVRYNVAQCTRQDTLRVNGFARLEDLGLNGIDLKLKTGVEGL
jgi:hypothetical protein